MLFDSMINFSFSFDAARCRSNINLFDIVYNRMFKTSSKGKFSIFIFIYFLFNIFELKKKIFSANPVLRLKKNWQHWQYQHFLFQVNQIFHLMECLRHQHRVKLVSFLLIISKKMVVTKLSIR